MKKATLITVALAVLATGQTLAQYSPSVIRQMKTMAEKGDQKAQFDLAVTYATGAGVSKDMQEAVKWVRMAAEQGYTAAQFNLGMSYATGTGVSKDVQEAVKWFRKAAEQGLVTAQYHLGSSYAAGVGVPQNMQEAAMWFRMAAEQGLAVAQYNLGVFYDKGLGVDKNPQEAVKWYLGAAEQGFPQAQNNLGACYDSGTGVNRDPQEAIKWYRRAAEQGLATAQYSLGMCYAEGEGVPKDYSVASEWFTKAAEQGHVKAARQAEYIKSAILEAEGEYKLAIQKSIRQFSADPCPDTADLLLSQLKRVYNHVIDKVQKKPVGEMLPMQQVHENLELLEVLKESVVLLTNKIEEMALGDEISSYDAAYLIKGIRKFKILLRDNRTAYVSYYVIDPYLKEAALHIKKADEPAWGHDKAELRQAIYRLSICSGTDVLYTAHEQIRIEFLELLAWAKNMAGEAEWNELRQFTKLLDSIDKSRCRGGERWLP